MKKGDEFYIEYAVNITSWKQIDIIENKGFVGNVDSSTVIKLLELIWKKLARIVVWHIIMSVIHNSAIISKTAEIGENVCVGPYAIIDDNVKVRNNVKIAAHAIIKSDKTVDGRRSLFYRQFCCDRWSSSGQKFWWKYK